MSTYTIPESYIPGFETIINLPDVDFNALVDLLSNLEIAQDFDILISDYESKFTTISAVHIKDVLRSLVSIVDIFENSGKDVTAFADNFSRSYLYSKQGATENESASLKERLILILKNFDSLSTTVKAQNLLTDNQRNFRDCRIITDLRMVFADNFSSEDKHAMVVHNLKLEFSKNGKLRDFFVALDLNDLKKLKSVVDRAIDKENTIKSTNHNFTFITF